MALQQSLEAASGSTSKGVGEYVVCDSEWPYLALEGVYQIWLCFLRTEYWSENKTKQNLWKGMYSIVLLKKQHYNL